MALNEVMSMLAPREHSTRNGFVGLTSAEALDRLAAGHNILVPEAKLQRWRRWLGPLTDPMVVLLLVAIPIYLTVGEDRDAIITAIALFPIIFVGWLMEARAHNALAKLRKLSASTIWTIRNGRWVEVPTEELVVGDIIEVTEGGVLPADGVVISATQIQVDESSLTGESLPLNKSTAVGESDVFAGSIVLAGRALVEVTVTGRRTRFGQIGALLATTKPRHTPLQKSMLRLVRSIAAIAAVCALGVIAIEVWRGNGWAAATIAGISLLIAAIPEEFSVVYSLYLALGAWRLARENAVVRNLPGVETLGSVTVICTDKTGTLTEGALEVHEVHCLAGAEDELLAAAVLASEPEPFDALDKAIVTYCGLKNVDVQELHRGELVQDWPFDVATKHLTHVWRLADGEIAIAAKGAYEGVLEMSQHTAADRKRLDAAHDAFTSVGMRVIAVAYGTAHKIPADRDQAERHLKILGLIGFHDPIKPNVAEAITACRSAGIRVILITGDHPATAAAVAAELGMVHADGERVQVANGAAIDALSDRELDELVATTDIFARTQPDQKHRLVTSLLRQGEVVAMTGDGVNDAPALRQADIGVVMGQRGTEVAREAATIVLLDDNFATIVAATRNGRLIYDNLSKAFRYLIAVHIPLVAIALIVPLLGLPLLLQPLHLILLEILLHPIVSLVFQAEPAAADIMLRPPRKPDFALSSRALFTPIMVGLTVSAAVIGVYAWGLSYDWGEAAARGAALATLLGSQLILMVSTRSADLPMWEVWVQPTRELYAGWLAVCLVIAGMFAIPALSELFAVAAFERTMFFPIICLIVISTLWTEVFKVIRSRGSR